MPFMCKMPIVLVLHTSGPGSSVGIATELRAGLSLGSNPG